MPPDDPTSLALAPHRGHLLTPGQRILDRYRVVRLLGCGSFGYTYLALDTTHGDVEVAIKRLRSDREHGWKAFELFEREAAALRSLRHHGIPQIYEHLREPGDGALVAYLVMEYIDGVSLEQRISDGASLDPADLLRLLLGLLDILEYLHSRVPPVLHRDIKPANILVRPDGSPVLVDFGAVRTVFRAADDAGSTVVGTFGYMPFEQTMGQASPASDLYAVGATLLHLITGRPPTQFVSSDGVIDVPASLPGGPVLRGVLARLLAPGASARYQSAREVRDALLAPVLAAPAPPVLGARAPPASAALARVRTSHTALEPAPRLLTGDLKARFDQVVLTPGHLFMGQRPSMALTPAQRVWYVLLSLLTFGILPLAYKIWIATRRQRIRPFFERGVPACGRVSQVHKTAIEWVEVRYDFVLDGVTHRGSDTIVPAVARLWDTGDIIDLLVLPDQSHDSIVISSA